MNNRARTLSNALFSSVGMYTEYALGMLTSIIIARYLGPEDFGAYSMVIWMVAVGVAISNAGSASAAIKFVAELRGGGNPDLIPPMLSHLRRVQNLFLLGLLLVGGVMFMSFGNKFAPGWNHWLLLGFLVVAVALRSSYMFNIGVAKGFENFKATATVALVSTPINLALVALAWWMDASVGWLLGVFLLSGCVFLWISRRQIAPLLPEWKPGATLPPELLARVRRHVAWSALSVSVGFFSASEVEVMFLNMHADSHAAGQFKVAYQLAVGATALVPGVFSALLLPMMASALSQGREIAARRFVGTTAYLALLGLPLIAFGLVFGGDTILLMYGREYLPAGTIFAFCLIGACSSMMGSGASSLLISADRQRSVLIVVSFFALMKLVLNAALIPHFGLNGAVAAYTFLGVASPACCIVLACRASGASLDWGRLGRVALAASIATLVAFPLRDHVSPWVSVLCGGAVLALVYALSTLLLGCWSRGDIEHLQHLHQRFAAGRPRAGARLLEWAFQRAPAGGSP